MFTGLIQRIGTLKAAVPIQGDLRMYIGWGGEVLAAVALGDSIAVSGCCLTAVEINAEGFWADVSRETLDLTVLGDTRIGSRVNLELAMLADTRLGGHMVSGHVDGIGRVVSIQSDARSARLRFEMPAELARYVARKGSICIDGVSLTVNTVQGCHFEVNIVPHTLSHTTLSDYRPDRRVNLEVDLIARYLERLVLGDRAATGVDEETLRRYGFIDKAQ
jgi:riboflavin synthase